MWWTPEAGTRFYYHAHRHGVPEHGHFHLFVHGPKAGDFMHLAALSLDHHGQPMRWFSTNRWVTAGRWRPAGEMRAALRRFEVRTHGRLAPVANWLTAMVRLFNEDLAELLRERDVLMATALAARRPRGGAGRPAPGCGERTPGLAGAQDPAAGSLTDRFFST